MLTMSATISRMNKSVCLLTEVPGTGTASVALLIICAATAGWLLLVVGAHEACLETTYSRYLQILELLTSPTALAMAHAPAEVGHVALTVTRLCARTEVSAAPMAPASCQLPRSESGKRCSIRLISDPICWETWLSNSIDESIGLVMMAS